MHAHKLLVKHIFSLPKDLFCLSTTRLFCLSLPPNIFCHSYHGCNLSLLLKPNQFLRQVIHGLGNNIGLQSLDGTIDDSLLVALEKIPLLLVSTLLLPLLGGSQLGDQIQSLFLAFEHHVLDGSSSNESL